MATEPEDPSSNTKPSRQQATDDALNQIRQLQVRLRDAERRAAEAEKQLQTQTNKPAVSDLALHSKLVQKLRPWADAATQIQAVWRGKLQRKRFLELLDDYASRTGRIPKSQISDELIMRQVAGAAKHKNMSLEQLYRAADIDADGVLTCDELTQFIHKIKLGLTPAQITRLMLILDEDFSGRIEQKEFYDALAAYRVATEHHRPSARTFEQEVLVKFIEVLEHRKIDPEEIFNLCDVNSDGAISTEELKVFVSGLNIGFQNKEVHALMKILDADNSGKVSHEEYQRHIHRATTVFAIESAMAGTSAAAPTAGTTKKSAFAEVPKQNEEVKAIIKKMESTGLSVADAFDRIEADRQGKLTIASFTRFVNKWYPNLSREEVISLIASVDLDRNSLLDLAELNSFLTSYSSASSKPNLRQTLRAMSVLVQRQGVSTSAFFTKHHVQSELDMTEFESQVARLFNLPREQSLQVFASLDINRQNVVDLQDLIAVLNSYRTDKSDHEEEPPASKFTETQGNKTVKEVQEVLTQNGLQPIHLFRFADKQNRNAVAPDDLKRAINKLLPSITLTLIDQMLTFLPSDSITKDAFLGLFEASSQQTLAKAAQPDSAATIMRLVAAMEKVSIDPDMIFTTADRNRDDKATIAELKAAIRRCVPENVLSQGDLNAVMVAIDFNHSGVVDRDTFIDLIYNPQASRLKTTTKPTPAVAVKPSPSPAAKPSPVKAPPQKQPEAKPEPKRQINLNEQKAVSQPTLDPPVAPAKPAALRRQTPEDLVFKKLSSICRPGQLAGTILVQQSGLQLSAKLKLKDLNRLFEGLTEAELMTAFNFLDPDSRGYVYLHSVATMADFYSEGDIGSFPLLQNQRAPEQAKTLLSLLAKNLDDFNKSAFQFYTFMGLQPEQRLNLANFTFKMKDEMSEAECKLMFPLCQFSGSVVVYHYISCIDSYCRPKDLREGQWSKATQPFSNNVTELVIQAVCSFPNEVMTKNLFNKTPLLEVLDVRAFTTLVKPVFRISDIQCQQLFAQLDENNFGKLFAYQLYTYVDCYRSMIDNGELTYEFPVLPYKSLAESSFSTIFRTLAAKLDSASQATANAWQVDLEANLTEPQFYGVLVGLSALEKQNLFNAFDILACKQVKFFHFLAVLDSYRKVFAQLNLPNSGAPSEAPVNLTQTTEKTAAHFAGANPSKRPLTARDLFGKIDADRDGIITVQDLSSVLDGLRSEEGQAISQMSGALGSARSSNLKPSINIDDLKLLSSNEIKLLLSKTPRTPDGKVNYQQFYDFIMQSSKPQAKPATGKAPGAIKGIDRRLTDFPEGSVDQGILKLKLYAQANLDSRSSLESTFKKLDEDSSGALNEQEFMLALNRMKLGLTDKQKAEFKKLADRNRDGNIQYEEFVDFIYDYNFSMQLEEEDLNASNHLLLRKAMTMTGSLIHEIENYVIEPEKDYFRIYNPKWTTILNSEHAALKRCKELLTNVKTFKDPDFGPEFKGGAFALYWAGEAPGANFPPPNELAWKSPREWLGEVNFFSDDISSNDVIQGSLGDCWFIGALSVLATRDELIRGSVESLTSPEQVTQDTILGISKGVYPPIFHSFSAKGLYVLKFFKNGAWRYVIIDERLPCYDQEGYEPSLVFGKNKDDREVWVSLVEKAFAKLHGCYEALGGGLIDDGLVDLTGFVAEKIKINGKGGVLDGPPAEEAAKAEALWQKIVNFRKEGTLMGCSIDGQGVESDVVVNGEMTGLLARHAYSLIDVLEIKNPKATKGRHRLVRLRNPWGQREWLGKWSDRSAEMETNIGLIKREINRMEEEERFDPENSEDGCFLMCFKDWRTLYNNLYACVDFTDEWSGIRFKDAWTQATSGGVPTKPDKAMGERWGKNPQFIVDLAVETELFISLQQEDGRCVKSLAFPYEGMIKTACFSVMRLNKTENGIATFDSSRIIKLSVLKLHREVSMRIKLPPGRYAIVPATMNPGELGTFFLSVYFSCDKKKISFFKRNEPENKGEVIEEEEETSAEEVPPDVIDEMRNLISYLRSI